MTIITDQAKQLLKASIMLFSNKTKAEKDFIIGIIDTCETIEKLTFKLNKVYYH